MTRDQRDKDTVQRARADLRRLDEQSEKVLGAGGQRLPDTDDPMEIWGKRIGRGLAVIAAAALIWHLLSTYVLK